MSAKGNKAKATKDPTPKRAPSAGRVPVRSPIDAAVAVSERHKFKTPSSSSDMNAIHGPCESTDEVDDSSPSPVHVSSTEKILDEVIERSTAY